MPDKTLGVFVDPFTVERREVFRLWGVPFTATPHAWLGVLSLMGAGVVLAAVLRPGAGGVWVGWGLVYGVLLLAMYLIHDVGHILGGRAVGAPMDENLITATRHVNIYRGDQSVLPGRVHVSRAAGGPLANVAAGLAAGVVLLAVGDASAGAYTVAVFCAANLLFGLGSLVPVPSIDGGIIWRNLLGHDNS